MASAHGTHQMDRTIPNNKQKTDLHSRGRFKSPLHSVCVGRTNGFQRGSRVFLRMSVWCTGIQPPSPDAMQNCKYGSLLPKKSILSRPRPARSRCSKSRVPHTSCSRKMTAALGTTSPDFFLQRQRHPPSGRRHQARQRDLRTTEVIVAGQVGAGRVRVVQLKQQRLLLFEEIVQHHTGLEHGVRIVLAAFSAPDLAPRVARVLTQRNHVHGIALGQQVAPGQVPRLNKDLHLGREFRVDHYFGDLGHVFGTRTRWYWNTSIVAVRVVQPNALGCHVLLCNSRKDMTDTLVTQTALKRRSPRVGKPRLVSRNGCISRPTAPNPSSHLASFLEVAIWHTWNKWVLSKRSR